MKKLIFPLAYIIMVASGGCNTTQPEETKALKADSVAVTDSVANEQTWKKAERDEDIDDSIRFSKTYYVDRIKNCPGRKGAVDVRCHMPGDTTVAGKRLLHFAFENDDKSPFDPGQKHLLTMAYFNNDGRLILSHDNQLDYKTADRILEETPSKEYEQALEEVDGDENELPKHSFGGNGFTLLKLMEKGRAVEQKTSDPAIPGPLLMLTKVTSRHP